MKLQRSPLILFVIALIFGGGVWIYETQKTTQPKAAEQASQKLFGFEESEVQKLILTTSTQNLVFTKSAIAPSASISPSPPSSTPISSPKNESATPDKPPVWQMTAPNKTAANDGTIAYLLNLMAIGSRQETLKIPASKKAEFGLEPPTATAEVTLFNQQTHRIVLGKPNFNRSGLYAQINPPTEPKGDLDIALVSMDFANAVNRPRSEWIHKPGRPKSAPSPSSSPSPDATP